MKIIIIGGLAESLIRFRGHLIELLTREGYEVIAMAGEADSNLVNKIEALGCKFITYPIERNSLNPLSDIKLISFLFRVFKKESPDVVISYTIKPVIWGGLTARFSGVRKHYAMITGLGYSFQPGGRLKSVLIWLVRNLYRKALKSSSSVIFQNTDNKRVFIEQGIVANKKCVLVNGSGVDLSHFKLVPSPQSPKFLLIARLLGDKGIREYVKAAEIVKSKYPKIVFDLVGPEDPSPDGISISEIYAFQDKGLINYHGETSDVRPFIKDSSIFVLPSYHEGMPRTVLEAMAMGRPILTTDVPGCRETVVNGENGWLVEKANVGQLAERMIWFIENQDKWSVMGQKSHIMANEKFDVHKVNAEILKIMGLYNEKAV